MKNLKNCVLLLCILANQFGCASEQNPIRVIPLIPRLVRHSRPNRPEIMLSVYPAGSLRNDGTIDHSYQPVLMTLTEATTNLENVSYPIEAVRDDGTIDRSYQPVLRGLTEVTTNLENAIPENTSRTSSPIFSRATSPIILPIDNDSDDDGDRNNRGFRRR